MPIYSYRCETCGFQQDVLRKMSDPLLVTCPSCDAPTFRKQVTAAGFQLKGSGWYVTDFRNPATKESSKSDKADKPASEGSVAKTADAPAPSTESATPAKASPAPAATGKASPAPSGGDS